MPSPPENATNMGPNEVTSIRQEVLFQAQGKELLIRASWISMGIEEQIKRLIGMDQEVRQSSPNPSPSRSAAPQDGM